MSQRDEIARQAMALSPDDRAYVADLLERSLAPAEDLAADVADAWSREIDRRIAAFDRGETNAVDFDRALEHMRRALEARRGPA